MTRIIAIANHKGGVGKTTTTALLGYALAHKGKKVLLVDLDAQANLTEFFIEAEEVEVSIYDALTKEAKLPVMPVDENLYLIPAELNLAVAEQELTARLARERALSMLLDPLKGEYDYILLDCPPSLGLLTTNALVAAEELFIPLTAEALPLKGLKKLEEVVIGVQRLLNPNLNLNGMIVTRYNNRKLNKAVLDAITSNYGEIVFKTKIRENITIAETPVYGGDIFKIAPDCNGAKDYESLAEEVIAQEK